MKRVPCLISPKFLLFFFLLFSLTPFLHAQLPVGTFRDHLPYDFFKVAIAKDRVYVATRMNLMMIDKSDASTSSWSKVDGLTEVGIATIAYSEESQTLIVAYNNSGIDLIKNDQLYHISDIKNKQMTGSKAIHNMYVDGSIAYISTAFGVVLLDLNKRYIVETWFTNRNSENHAVYDFEIFNNRIYLSTSKGIYSIVKDSRHVANFAEWRHETEMGNRRFPIIKSFHDRLFVVENGENKDKLFFLQHDEWKEDTTTNLLLIRSIESNEKEVIFCDWNCCAVFDTEMNKVLHWGWHWDVMTQGRHAIADKEGYIWVADERDGAYRYNRSTGDANRYTINGPHDVMVGHLHYANGVTALVPGTRSGWGILYYPPSISWFSNNEWQYINADDIRVFEEPHDLNVIVVNPKNNKEFYVGMWSGGLLKVVDGKVHTQYNHNNSPLDTADGKCFVSGLCFDKDNNLWVTNSRVAHPLKVLKNDGTWEYFSLNTGVVGMVAEHVLVDSRGYKWITFPRASATQLLAVFDDRGTISDKSDDRMTYIDMNSMTDSEISTSTVTCIAEDHDQKMWIGTDKGIKVITNTGQLFSKTVYAQGILIEQLEFAQYLFQYEQITAIAVDGANRKWVGTAKAGIFLISEDGREELLHFTEDNSPLFSNQINSISINSENGEVFIGTGNGLLSYRGYATDGKADFEEATVFPNPVRENYFGNIAVSGLMDNAFCKIVDAAGRLVWQGYAYGGQFIWNGKDYAGNRPATGVYFVFASDKTGKEKKVAKILFIN